MILSMTLLLKPNVYYCNVKLLGFLIVGFFFLMFFSPFALYQVVFSD